MTVKFLVFTRHIVRPHFIWYRGLQQWNIPSTHTKHYSPQFPANSITHKISHATVAQGYISRSPNKSTHSIVIIAWDSHSPDISIINKQIIIHTKIKKSISQHLDTNVNKAKIDIKKLVLQCWNEKINFQYSLPTHRYKTNLKTKIYMYWGTLWNAAQYQQNIMKQFPN